MDLGGLVKLGRAAGVPGIALGAVVLVVGAVLNMVGAVPDTWRGPVLIAIVLGVVLLGVPI